MENTNFPRPTASLSTQQFDLIVVGGGITGAGIAQDAASRGLKCLLVEMGDFASGTSSKSTKLIHGGLRYLENLQFRVTLESVRERQLQQKLAPHMVWSLPFVIPKYRSRRLKTIKMGLGLWLYDLMAAGCGNLKWHRSISRDEVLAACPGIKSEGLTGGYVYYDCRTDDARHTLAVIQSAIEHGALAFNYTRVVGFSKEAGRIAGVEVVDTLAGDSAPRIPIRGRVVVNATGVWTQSTTELGGIESDVEVVPAKGIHITLDRNRLPIKSAMIVPSVRDRRFCFAIPWYDCVVVGTTDTAYSGSLSHVAVEPDEVSYLIEALNAQFPASRISAADVTGSYAGLRPLVKAKGARSTADISREHRLEESAGGLVSISGGKLTTYRRMAIEVVDLASERIGGRAGACQTGKLMLGGWEQGDDVDGIMLVYARMAEDLGLPAETAAYLPSVYGKRTTAVLDLVRADGKLAEPLAPGHPQIAAQVVYAVQAEGARTVDDVLARRMRLAITNRQAALSAAEKVAALMAPALGWGDARLKQELDRCRTEWV